MRIGIVCYPTYGGSGAVATELGLALAERGHDVHFISYALPFRLRFNERVTFHEVKIGSYPLFEHPPYSLALAVMLHEVAVPRGGLCGSTRGGGGVRIDSRDFSLLCRVQG